ncbi:8096_t:CDS:2, partial [Paraglomus brasilianum]
EVITSLEKSEYEDYRTIARDCGVGKELGALQIRNTTPADGNPPAIPLVPLHTVWNEDWLTSPISVQSNLKSPVRTI